MNTLAERIAFLIELKELNVSSFERKAGLGRNVISQVLRRGSEVKSDILVAILKAFPEVDPAWLLLGEGTIGENNATVADTSFATLDKIEKENIVSYLTNNEAEFDKLENFQKYKTLLIKDGVIQELIKQMKKAGH